MGSLASSTLYSTWIVYLENVWMYSTDSMPTLLAGAFRLGIHLPPTSFGHPLALLRTEAPMNSKEHLCTVLVVG